LLAQQFVMHLCNRWG